MHCGMRKRLHILLKVEKTTQQPESTSIGVLRYMCMCMCMYVSTHPFLFQKVQEAGLQGQVRPEDVLFRQSEHVHVQFLSRSSHIHILVIQKIHILLTIRYIPLLTLRLGWLDTFGRVALFSVNSMAVNFLLAKKYQYIKNIIVQKIMLPYRQ